MPTRPRITPTPIREALRAALAAGTPASRSIGTMCTTSAEHATAIAPKPSAMVQNGRERSATRRRTPASSLPTWLAATPGRGAHEQGEIDLEADGVSDDVLLAGQGAEVGVILVLALFVGALDVELGALAFFLAL